MQSTGSRQHTLSSPPTVGTLTRITPPAPAPAAPCAGSCPWSCAAAMPLRSRG